MKKHIIKIYSTPSCPYCVMAKDYFKNKGVEFKDIDVSMDSKAAQEMINKSGQMGVPVIDIDDNITVGFRPDVFEHLLSL
ncbi:MAG: glutaredoxin domain-containing protein [Minisyncoccota bacterium]